MTSLRIENMTEKQNNVDRDRGVNPPSTGIESHDKSSDSIFSHRGLVREANGPNHDGSRPRGSTPEAASTDKAQQYSTEVPESPTTEEYGEQYMASLTRGIIHRDAILPPNEKETSKSDNSREPCYCLCHERNFDGDQPSAQREPDTAPLHGRYARGPSEAWTEFHLQVHSMRSPCQVCPCYKMREASSSTSDQRSDEGEES